MLADFAYRHTADQEMKNRLERAEPRPEEAGRVTGAVRRNSHEPTRPRAFPQRKRPTENGWPWVNGSGVPRIRCVTY